MPTFYNYTENGVAYSFDDVFVPAIAFRQQNLLSWGYNGNGQLGDNNGGTNSTIPIPTFAGGTNWNQVTCGFYNTAAIKTDGTLWTWGHNLYGTLGVNDSSYYRLTPVTTFAGGTNWKQVSVGQYHTAAIKTDGTLWTWGWGPQGQLGNNDSIDIYTPVTTFAGGTNWSQVACGKEHTAAIKTDGTLWVWGGNYYGTLGVNGTGYDRNTPVTTFSGGTNWKQVSNGGFFTAAIKTDGTLWTWGYNYYVQLGINNRNNRSIPVTTFAGGTNWNQVSCGYHHTTAIRTNGTLWTWGRNYNGQLGNNQGYESNRTTPVTTFAGGTTWKEVSAGLKNTAAIKTDGTLWIWGYNDTTYNPVGNNWYSNVCTPATTFTGGTNWKQVATGDIVIATITYTDDY